MILNRFKLNLNLPPRKKLLPVLLIASVLVITSLSGFIFYHKISAGKVVLAEKTQKKEKRTTKPKKLLKKENMDTDKNNSRITPTPIPTQIITQDPAKSSNSQQSSSPIPTSLPHQAEQQSSGKKVTIVEYGDFQCPFCESFYHNALTQIKDTYVNTGKASFEFRHFPLPSHPNAEITSLAAECAREQGKFWEYHNTLYDKQGEWSNKGGGDLTDALLAFAIGLSLNSESFHSCLVSQKFVDKINSDKSQGQGRGVSATPTVFINDQILVGALPYESFKAVIEQELNK